MIKITVKTIDSNNFDFEVEDNISVKDFKELIASKVQISVDLQRLIFCGRVLTDDKLLKDYEINDGKVVHLVKRAPPSSSSHRSGSAPTSVHSSPRHTHSGRRWGSGRTSDDNSYLVGAFTIPQEAFNPNGFQQILQNMVQNMGDIGRNATVMSRTSDDGSSVDVQINLSQMPPQNECRQRIAQANRFIGYINAIIEVIERPENIPSMNENTTGSNERSHTPSHTFNIDANNMGSLEAQLAAQATAAASNALGIPIMSSLFGTPTQRSSQNNGSQNTNQMPTNNQNTTNSSNNWSQRNQLVSASEVNHLMNSVFRAQERLRPHIQRFQQLMTIEGQLSEQQISEAINLQRNCQRATHHLSHVFHLLSDLTINFNSQNRSVGVIQSTQSSMESVSVSLPFASQTSNTESSARSQTQNTGTANNRNTSNQSSEEHTATVNTTTHSTTSVPRFAQSFSGDRSSSVYSTQSPIVVMEVGSTVERIQIPTTNANNAPNDNIRNTLSNSRPLFIPPFDPFLQCNSPYTIPEIRTRVSVGITTGRNSRQSNQNQNNNTNSANNDLNENQSTSLPSNMPFGSLGQLLNGIISGFVGQANGSPNNNNNNNNNTNNININNPSNISSTGEPSLNVDPTLIDLMGRLNNQRPPQENNGENEENATNMTDMFMSFVNGILQIISGGQTNTINVADFLNQLEGFSYVEGENIANDIFMVMARVLNFHDLFYIFAGNSEPLIRVREPLKEFVQTSVLNGSPPIRDNIEDAITSIINSWRPGLEVMASGLTLVPGINLMSTIEHFLRFNLNRIFQFFLFPPDTEYGNTFFRIIREIMLDLISLSQLCFTDGVLSLQRMVGAFIEHISSELNPAIQEWMRSVAIRHLNEYINNNNNTEQTPNMDSYIVRTNLESDDSMTANGGEDVPNESDSVETESVEFIDAQTDFDQNINSNSVQMDASFNDIGCELPAVVIGSESWHSSVPSDWVPIITNDLERQRRHTIQRPFSDAYLNGVSKRRRIERRPLNLRDSLQNALISSGVRPIVQTNTEEIMNQISDNSGLNLNFDELVRSAVRERIGRDDDYSNARTQTPERFSNSHKYFNQKK